MATLKWNGRTIPFIRSGTFQETSDIEVESGIPLEKMTSSHKGAVAVLISLRRAGIVMSWADVMQLDGDDLDVVEDPTPADPTPAAPARRAPQDRKPRARRGAAAAASQAE